MATNDVEVQSKIDSLLDMNLDDIADLPEFKPFPAGAHSVTIGFESKPIGDHPAIVMKLTAVATVELADPTTGVPIVAGDTTDVSFMLDNEFGTGKLKEVLKPLAAHFGTVKNRDTIAAAEGASCLVVTKVRTNKDKTASYTDIVSLSVL
jgi:hypothetical protein